MVSKYQQAELVIGQEVDPDLLAFYFDLIESRVKNFCHIEAIPAELELVIVQMVVEFYRGMESQRALQVSGGREVSSISRGDTTISYGSGSSADGGVSLRLDSILASYAHQLYAFRRLQTPREVDMP